MSTELYYRNLSSVVVSTLRCRPYGRGFEMRRKSVILIVVLSKKASRAACELFMLAALGKSFG